MLRYLNEEAAKSYLDPTALSELVRQHAQFATGDAPIFVWNEKAEEKAPENDSEDEEALTTSKESESPWKRVNDKPPVWLR